MFEKLVTSLSVLGLTCACTACDNDRAVEVPSQPTTSAVARSAPEPSVDVADWSAPAAAWVDGEPIERADVDRRIERLRTLHTRQGRSFRPPVEAAKRRAVTQRLVDRHLLERHLLSEGIEIDEATLSAELRRRVDEDFGSFESLEAHLRTTGQSVAEYKDDLRMELAVERLFDRATIEAGADPDALYELYRELARRPAATERVRVSTIVLRGRPDERGALRARMKRLLERAESGESFRSLARRHSEGPNAAKGGALGWVERDAVDATVEEALFGTDATENATAPLETPTGFHAFWIHERDRAPTDDFERVRDRLRKTWVRREIDRRRNALVDRLRQDADIRIAGMDADVARDAGVRLKNP